MSDQAANGAQAPTPAGDRRENDPVRILGHLVSLSGMQAIVACAINPQALGHHWSVGHLISVAHAGARMVGVVCDLETKDHLWHDAQTNMTMVRIELTGEIVDEAPGKPVFYRGIRNFPALGSIAHRIRQLDLRAIYTFRGKEGVTLGQLSQNADVPATVDVAEMINRHFAVVGSTGVGKTTSVSMLVKHALRSLPKLRAIILDPHNEYARHFGRQAVVLDSDSLELPYWLFRFEELVDVVYGGRTPSAEALDAFYDVVKTAKTRFNTPSAAQAGASPLRRQPSGDGGAGAYSADSPVPFRIADALAVIEEFLGKLEEPYPRSELRALRNRLETLNRDPRYRFMFSRFVEDSLAKTLAKIFRIPVLGKPCTIIQLAGLPNEVVNAVVSVIARLSFEMALWSEKKYEVLLLCEEAHRYISADSKFGFLPTRVAIGRIAKEGRKYGSSLGIVTQRPSELDPTVLSQCSTMFAMRLANEADKGIIRAAVSGSSTSTVAFLSSMADREAIAFGEAIPTPMRMKFGDYREFEAAVAGVSSPEPEAVDMRQIVSALRGEFENVGEPAGGEQVRAAPAASDLAPGARAAFEGGFGLRVAR